MKYLILKILQNRFCVCVLRERSLGFVNLVSSSPKISTKPWLISFNDERIRISFIGDFFLNLRHTIKSHLQREACEAGPELEGGHRLPLLSLHPGYAVKHQQFNTAKVQSLLHVSFFVLQSRLIILRTEDSFDNFKCF